MFQGSSLCLLNQLGQKELWNTQLLKIWSLMAFLSYWGLGWGFWVGFQCDFNARKHSPHFTVEVIGVLSPHTL